MRVYLGWSKLTRQMDNFISLTGNGGGSEIKVGRLSGYLKLSEEQVTGFSGDMVTLYFTRSEIRKGKWKRVFSIWDNDWNKDDFEQVYAVYEDDTKGKKTISGTVSTTMNLQERPAASKIQGEIGYKVDIITQDEILTQRKVDRASFFRDGLSDQGWKYMADPNDFLSGGIDWPVYDGGTIWQYTMPWRGN